MARLCSPSDTVAPSPATETAPSSRFIDGEPMNAATNRLAGSAYRTSGSSTCCRRPSRMTATRSPIVIASIWSWVT